MQTKSVQKILMLSVNIEKLRSINFHTLFTLQITVERLKCCDWSPHKFTEVHFSKLTDSNQMFMVEFVCIYYDLSEIPCQIIQCNFFCPYVFSIQLTTPWYNHLL